MSTTNGRGKRQSFGGTGFYIALFLGVTALAVAGYWTLFPHSRTMTAKTDEPQVSSAPAPQTPSPATKTPAATAPAQTRPANHAGTAPTIAETDPAPARPAQGTATIPVTVPDPEPAETVRPSAPRLIVPPLAGETVAAFSMEELRYSPTFGDWRTHDGLDIAAEPGTQVLAACSGTVRAVTEDDMLGTTVVLVHEGGYETTYANLQASPPVGEGQYVSAGQVIGTVGSSALAESGEPPHLHFAVTKDGEAVDPDKFLNS